MALVSNPPGSSALSVFLYNCATVSTCTWVSYFTFGASAFGWHSIFSWRCAYWASPLGPTRRQGSTNPLWQLAIAAAVCPRRPAVAARCATCQNLRLTVGQSPAPSPTSKCQLRRPTPNRTCLITRAQSGPATENPRALRLATWRKSQEFQKWPDYSTPLYSHEIPPTFPAPAVALPHRQSR